MTRRPVSLGARLLLGAAVLTLAAMVVAGAVTGFALRHFIQGQVDGRLDGQILAVADALRQDTNGQFRLERIVDGPPFDRPLSGWYWEVLAPEAVLRSRSLATHAVDVGPLDEPPPGQGPDGRPRPMTADGTGPPDEPLRVRARRVAFGATTVTIIAAAPREALFGPWRDAMTPVVTALALLALLLIAGGAAQVWLGLRPLRHLRHELVALRAGQTERIDGPQPAEIGPLVAELNALLDHHDANLERARRHVANLAHSLKTPLATIAVTIDEPGHDPDRRLKPLVTTMDRMIRHHLARARAAVLGGPSRARVTLAPRIDDHRAAFTRLYADKALRFEIAVPGDIAVACEAQDLDEMLGNLLDNACRFARRCVAIAATPAGSHVRLSIADDGPGLPDGDCEDMLLPGRRLDESAPGYGFGLPIARELVELYGGSIALSRSTLGGLDVALVLPRAADPGRRS